MNKKLRIVLICVVVLGIAGFYWYSNRAYFALNSRMDKIPVPMLKSERGAELINDMKESWKEAFEIVYESDVPLSAEEIGKRLKKKENNVITLIGNDMFKKYGISDSLDQKKIGDFNLQCLDVHIGTMTDYKPQP